MKYIKDKKRGWRELKEELLLESEEDPVDMEDIGGPVRKSSGSSDEDSDESPRFDKRDKEMVTGIRDKQMHPVSESTAKHKTDLRKYAISRALAGKGGQIGKALKLFFVKNSPIGYNRSVQTEEQGVYDYQFDPAFDRDFTFTPQTELDTERRTKTDYFRATASHKHFRRDQWDRQLAGLFRREAPTKARAVGGKQVYMSFHVDVTDDDPPKLTIVSPQGPYQNVKMLGARTDKPTAVHQVMVGDRPLTLWINEKSAGHQSRYNASAIVPNQWQYSDIVDALGGREVETGPAYLKPEKKFRPDTIKWTLGSESEEPIDNYKGSMMADRKDLIAVVSAAINKSVKPGLIKAIAATADGGFYQYPCLILQPMVAYAQIHNLEFGKAVGHLKENIVLTLHEQFQFSFANRPSFGFANPTVGDVGASVRIWPGLLHQSLFQEIIFKTLLQADLLNDAPPVTVQPRFAKRSPLVEALSLAMIRAKIRYRRYEELAKSRSFADLSDKYSWVLNRITSNVIKAEMLIKLLMEKPTDPYLNHRATRTLENLNEYDLVQAGLEEDVQAPTRSRLGARAATARRESLLMEIRKPVMEKEIAGWEPIAVRIRSSGMDAHRAALEIVGDAREKATKLYFETRKVNTEFASRLVGMKKAGSITKMMDPSYNFVSQEDVDAREPFTWEKEGDLPAVHIYDITNTTLDDTFGVIGDLKPDFVICFESLSKHFQFGMDKSTLGRLIVYKSKTAQDSAEIQELEKRAKDTQDTPLQAFGLNYIALQSQLFGV